MYVLLSGMVPPASPAPDGAVVLLVLLKPKFAPNPSTGRFRLSVHPCAAAWAELSNVYSAADAVDVSSPNTVATDAAKPRVMIDNLMGSPFPSEKWKCC